MPEHYDVIIIGTGAGGGTLAHRLAPSGKRILLLERGGYLPREPENWDCEEVFRKRALPDRARSGSTRTARSSSPTSSTTSAATRSSTARSCSACASATSARSATTADLARVADLLRRPRALLRRGRAALPRARRARRGPDRAARARARSPYPAVSHEPRIQQLHDDLERTGPPPVPPAGRRRPRRVGPGGGALRALRPLRRLPVPRRRQGRRARPLRAARRSSTPT